jgi:Phage tail lysozyme/Hemopexin
VGARQTYFFKGAGYLRYNIDTDLVDVGPVEISKFWTHLPREFQSDLDAVVNWGDGHAYFFKGAGYLRYNIETDLVDVGPVEISKFWTHLPREFQSDLDDIVNWSPNITLHWEKVSADQRRVEVMERLIDVYDYPVNAAAGIVGNLRAESFVIPTCVEGATEQAPMRAPNFQNQLTTFTAQEIKDRNTARQVGPKLPGAGLAQWTSPGRRAGLFAHPFRGSALGHRVLFNMDAQIDYLVHELRSPGFVQAQTALTNPAVTANAASDAVLLHFERPQSASQKINARRGLTQQALSAYRRVHP